MLPFSQRLRLKKDFERVFIQGKSYNSKNFLLKTVQNSLNLNRFGFIISNKVLKKATDRNLLKRRMRFVINKNMNSIQKQGFDVAFLTKREYSGLTYEKIEDEMLCLLKKADLLLIV